MSLEVSYNVPEVEGLVEAAEIFRRLQMQTVYNYPIWRKLYHASEYIKKRQGEVLAATLAPEEEE